MRKPRNYDSELKALETKARQLKARRQSQLGELVIGTGADALTADELAGALLMIAGTTDSGTKEAWRKRGATFFSGERQSTGNSAGSEPVRAAPDASGTPPARGEQGAA
jgi:DNA-binding protein H-NS